MGLKIKMTTYLFYKWDKDVLKYHL